MRMTRGIHPRRRVVRHRPRQIPLYRPWWGSRRRFLYTRRLIVGSAVIIVMVNSTNSYKLYQEDIEKIERDCGRSIEDITETELIEAMNRLGIRRLDLSNQEERIVVNAVEKESRGIVKAYCTQCGSVIEKETRFCIQCGSALN
ncbi:MAG: zinc ribbon domain-containing protein [Candidatus Hodarchaeota archaeon]